MTRQEQLLEKYFRGESTLEEERELRVLQQQEGLSGTEAGMFGFFAAEGEIPEGLEEELMAGFEKMKTENTGIRKLVSWISVAAVVLVILTVYIDFRKQRNSRIENQFLTMEQALYQVSESIRPQEQQQMLVLWVDENTEIIIN